jgi:hypothetical protein
MGALIDAHAEEDCKWQTLETSPISSAACHRKCLPALHIEDGRGGVAGYRPGFAYSPKQLHDRAHPRADDPRRQAFEDYQKRLTEAWKNP